MRGPIYDIGPGSEYLIPFARKRLAQLKTRLTADCPFLRARVFDSGTDTADVELGRFVSRIRTRTSGSAWYFSVRETTTYASGVFQVETKAADISASALEPRFVELVSSSGFSLSSVRASGRSLSVYTSRQGVPEATAPLLFFMEPSGARGVSSDPAGALAAETSLLIHGVSLGRTRRGILLSAGGARLYFTDGAMVQDHATDTDFPGGGLIGSGVFVVGPASEEDVYYHYVVSTGGGPQRFRLFLADRVQPTDSGGNPLPAAPNLLFSGDHFTDGGGARVVANDYDVLTVTSPMAFDGGAGAREIRINGDLYWSSPGTMTGPSAPPDGFSENWDDAYIVSAHGDGERFSVLLSNYAGYIVFVEPSLVARGLDVFIRELIFTRGGSGYSMVEHTYYLTRVKTASIAGAFFAGGFRSAVYITTLDITGSPVLRTAYAAWLKEGTVVTVKDFGNPFLSSGGHDRTLSVARPAVESFADRVEAAFDWNDEVDSSPFVRAIGFSGSEAGSFLEVDFTAGSYPGFNGVLYSSGSATHMYVAVARSFIADIVVRVVVLIRSDGTVVAPVINGWAPSTVEGLRVDEESRTVYALIGNSRVGRVVDFGDVRSGETSRRVFVLRNTSSAPAEITVLSSPSSGVLFSPPSGEVPSGGEVSFTVELDTSTLGSVDGTFEIQLGGTVYTQRVIGRVIPALSPSLAPYGVPVFGDMAEIVLKTDFSDVARFDVDAESVFEFGSGFATFGGLTLPALAPHYRGRLLAQWAAEDEALESGGG